MTKKTIEELLAAPDSVKQSATERAKYQQRKATEEARKRRLEVSKLDSPPSMEDMLADLIRVAEDEDTNPWAKFRSISPRRYELYGHYPIAALDQEFGQFSHALEVAGLRDQKGTRLWRANRANQSRIEHSQRYAKRYVEPYVARARDYRRLTQPYLLASISDTHSQMLCPFVWYGFRMAIRDLQPDGVLFNGDTLDAVSISRHKKIPGWCPSLKSELQFKKEMFRQVREDHDGDLFDTNGNHDLADRLVDYLTQGAPEVIGLVDDEDDDEECGLRIDRLMGLDRYDVKLFHGGTRLSPRGTEDAKTGFLLWDSYRIHHGTRLGQNPARAELLDAGRSGQSGHVHRAGLAFGTTEVHEGMSWMCTPMGARHEVGRSYIKGTNTGWQRGFGLAYIYPDGAVHQYPVVVHNERLTFEGFSYERDPSLMDPVPSGIWLRDMEF